MHDRCHFKCHVFYTHIPQYVVVVFFLHSNDHNLLDFISRCYFMITVLLNLTLFILQLRKQTSIIPIQKRNLWSMFHFFHYSTQMNENISKYNRTHILYVSFSSFIYYYSFFRCYFDNNTDYMIIL